jgi:hypothetical protein
MRVGKIKIPGAGPEHGRDRSPLTIFPPAIFLIFSVQRQDKKVRPVRRDPNSLLQTLPEQFY